MLYLEQNGPLLASGTVFNYDHAERVILDEIFRSNTARDIQNCIGRDILSEAEVDNLRERHLSLYLDRVVDHFHDVRSGLFHVFPATQIPPFRNASLSDRPFDLGDEVRMGKYFMRNGLDRARRLRAARKAARDLAPDLMVRQLSVIRVRLGVLMDAVCWAATADDQLERKLSIVRSARHRSPLLRQPERCGRNRGQIGHRRRLDRLHSGARNWAERAPVRPFRLREGAIRGLNA